MNPYGQHFRALPRLLRNSVQHDIFQYLLDEHLCLLRKGKTRPIVPCSINTVAENAGVDKKIVVKKLNQLEEIGLIIYNKENSTCEICSNYLVGVVTLFNSKDTLEEKRMVSDAFRNSDKSELSKLGLELTEDGDEDLLEFRGGPTIDQNFDHSSEDVSAFLHTKHPLPIQRIEDIPHMGKCDDSYTINGTPAIPYMVHPDDDCTMYGTPTIPHMVHLDNTAIPYMVHPGNKKDPSCTTYGTPGVPHMVHPGTSAIPYMVHPDVKSDTDCTIYGTPTIPYMVHPSNSSQYSLTIIKEICNILKGKFPKKSKFLGFMFNIASDDIDMEVILEASDMLYSESWLENLSNTESQLSSVGYSLNSIVKILIDMVSYTINGTPTIPHMVHLDNTAIPYMVHPDDSAIPYMVHPGPSYTIYGTPTIPYMVHPYTIHGTPGVPYMVHRNNIININKKNQELEEKIETENGKNETENEQGKLSGHLNEEKNFGEGIGKNVGKFFEEEGKENLSLNSKEDFGGGPEKIFGEDLEDDPEDDFEEPNFQLGKPMEIVELKTPRMRSRYLKDEENVGEADGGEGNQDKHLSSPRKIYYPMFPVDEVDRIINSVEYASSDSLKLFINQVWFNLENYFYNLNGMDEEDWDEDEGEDGSTPKLSGSSQINIEGEGYPYETFRRDILETSYEDVRGFVEKGEIDLDDGETLSHDIKEMFPFQLIDKIFRWERVAITHKELVYVISRREIYNVLGEQIEKVSHPISREDRAKARKDSYVYMTKLSLMDEKDLTPFERVARKCMDWVLKVEDETQDVFKYRFTQEQGRLTIEGAVGRDSWRLMQKWAKDEGFSTEELLSCLTNEPKPDLNERITVQPCMFYAEGIRMLNKLKGDTSIVDEEDIARLKENRKAILKGYSFWERG